MELTEEQILKRLNERIEELRKENTRQNRMSLFFETPRLISYLEEARDLVKQSIAEAQKAPQEPPSQSAKKLEDSNRFLGTTAAQAGSPLVLP